MLQYIIRRILISIPTLVISSIVIFGIIQMTPGDPLSRFESPDNPLSEEEKTRLYAIYGLDKPLHIQYFIWAENVFTGDLGESFNWNKPVWDLMKEKIVPTVELAGLSLLLSLVIAIPVGTLSAIRQYSLLDNTMTFFSFIGIALPNFWFGLMLMAFFSIFLGWLPTQMYISATFEGNAFDWWVDHLRHLIMPLVVLTTAQVAAFQRYMRSQVLEVLRDDYVNTARSKGLEEQRVITKHVLKNALLPVVTLLGLSLPALLSGALITEQVFSWPGLGQFFWAGATARDYPVVMGLLFVIAVVTLLGNFLADLAYAYLDPRIKYT
jgi:peptide/nickel transport system permease protein